VIAVALAAAGQRESDNAGGDQRHDMFGGKKIFHMSHQLGT
jgi:hypothetical protein